MERPILAQISPFLEKNKVIAKMIRSAEYYVSSLSSNIKKTALDYFSRRYMDELKKIPIEELAQSKKGIRIKLLQDSGYHTIAEVYAAPEPSLASIYGIGQTTARLIKKESLRIANEIKDNVAIRISPDEKTPITSSIISSVFKYRLCNEWIQKSNSIFQSELAHFNNYAQYLTPATDALSWLFSFPSTKKQTKRAFDYIKSAIEGGAEKKQNEIIQSWQTLDYFAGNEKNAWEDFSKNPIEFIKILEEIVPGIFSRSDTNQLLPEELIRQIQNQCFFPDGLLCQLRPYQIFGVKYILHQENVLLGDEMGLGKTVQAIATMVSLRNTGATHFLIVCPASVLANWFREIRKMSLLNAIIIHGHDAVTTFQSWQKGGDVAITTFGMLDKILPIIRNKFSFLVVDEAHYIKNSRTGRTINVKSLCRYADRILFMTGTPLENNVGEMCNLIHMLQPVIASSVAKLTSIPSAMAFRKMVAPVYYRRKREEVLKELPALTESDEWCIMNSNEERVYERTVFGKNFMEIRRLSWNADDLHESCKAIRMKEIIVEAKADGRKIIVFSFFLETMNRIKSFLEKDTFCTPILSGSITPNGRQKIVDDFEKAPAGAVLLSQIEAGGTGLNIQSASVVIICEPQLKPSTENQAISRVYRMGQTRKVLVYRLLCEDTIDERLTEILGKKQKIFNAFADKSVAAQETAVNVSKHVIENLIKEEIDRINRKHRK